MSPWKFDTNELINPLCLTDTPEQPQNLTAFNITSRSIALKWVEPHHNNAPVTGYRVSYTRPDFLIGSGGSDGMVELEASGESVVVMGLHPGVEYVFTVVAVNDIGDSLASEPEVATTLEEGELKDILQTFFNVFLFLQFPVIHHRW